MLPAKTEAVVANDRGKELAGKDEHNTCGPDKPHVAHKSQDVSGNDLAAAALRDGPGDDAADRRSDVVDYQRLPVAQSVGNRKYTVLKYSEWMS